MQRTNIWHKLHLYRYQIILFIFIAINVSGQKLHFDWDQNLPHYDDKNFHYGFTLSLNSSKYGIKNSELYTSIDSVQSMISPRSQGFGLGFIVNRKINDVSDIRLLPTVAFYNRYINYTFSSGKINKQAAENVFLEFPIMIKYKSVRRDNHRLYVTGGFKTAIEAGSKKKEKKKTELRTNSIDFSIDYGLGIDLYFEYFKFSPEIRFSHGLVNLRNDDPNIFSQNILKMTSHTITVYFHFQ